MIVKIEIEVSLDEVEKYRKEFFECNGVELHFEVAKKNYLEGGINMSVNDELGIRMKTFYEEIPKTKLMRRTPVAIRILVNI